MSEDLMKAIELLVFGWGGVFIVIFIIYIASQILTKLFPPKK
ncbi:Na+-transporting methylmalonyl-CoA/oxaloacetate decarboxylase gamma subunit [Enterococcus sp. PF1-24]|nr:MULTISPECIES: OadG-related small transporter subunit [unclassified Enterococcus]MDH6365826.1 Na+-transporting methylmalonyl-CoA/oxaloacetate decarboxylase gamma subunit [Enterococcus sp. PFB1-1]MDH6400762.1 Na+-transporting methylmalonyl-CoA/oxaloacetate decarboxylase gamma subunit [Enterococcus sp. PF1-24]